MRLFEELVNFGDGIQAGVVNDFVARELRIGGLEEAL